jgi:hypothetical protein
MCSLMQQHKPLNMPQLHEGQAFAGVYSIFYVTPPVASQALPPPLPFPPCFYRCWLGVCLAVLPRTGAVHGAQCSSMCSLQQQPRPLNMPQLHEGQTVIGVCRQDRVDWRWRGCESYWQQDAGPVSIMLTAEQQRRQDKVSICVLSGAGGGGRRSGLEVRIG